MTDLQARGPMTDAENDCQILRELQAAPALFNAIAAASPEERKHQRQLRQQFDDGLVRAALAVDDARKRARGLLPAADQLWLTRIGLEQSTAWQVACHKAQRFSAFADVADLCCGIGIDAAAIAAVANVTAYDLDPAMVLRCEWNSRILQPAGRVTGQAMNVTDRSWAGLCVHADPDRRSNSDRPVKRLEQYQPALDWMQELASTAAAGAIKISPASNFMQKFPDCEIELISLNGECREATVWFGELAGPHPFRATVLPSGDTLSIDPLSAWAPVAEQCAEWLYDPDPAVVRSGMLDGVAEQLGLQRLDPEEEYLTGPHAVTSGFVNAFQVEAVLPNNVRDLKQWLRQNDPSSHYEIKCRRIPTDAAALQKRLPTGTAGPRTILLARIAGRARFVVAQRR